MMGSTRSSRCVGAHGASGKEVTAGEEEEEEEEEEEGEEAAAAADEGEAEEDDCMAGDVEYAEKPW